MDSDSTVECNTNMRQNFLNLCHDIRTPLNVILGMTSLAWTNLDDAEKVSNCLSRIEITSNYMLELINDILDLSKIEGGKMIIHKEEFSLPDLIYFLNIMIEPLTLQKHQNYESKFINLPQGNLVGDSLRLNQILMNLLTNAVKYTAVGGTIKLEIRQIPVDQENVTTEFKIYDSGIGMSEAFMERMFEPFAQANDRYQVRNTSGLGLPITKSLVTLMSGTIQVNSQQNVGTCITVQIPFGQLQQTELMKNKEQWEDAKGKALNFGGCDFKGKRVLIVEDNLDILEITVEILGQTGIDIECARDGLEAIKLFEASSSGYFNAILMDVMMPQMDGLEASRRIRSSGHTDAKQIAIIAMTANAFSEDVEATREAGMNDHVAKPINYNDFLYCLKNTLNSNK